MSFHHPITRKISGAIAEARQNSPFKTVTVIAPSKPSALQWRRRVARHNQSLFNVRWIDLNQLAQEILARTNRHLHPVTSNELLATAWKALQDSPKSFMAFRNSEDLPSQMVKAFDTLDALPQAEFDIAIEALAEPVRKLYEQYTSLLSGRDKHSNMLTQATEALAGALLPIDESFLLLQSGAMPKAQQEFSSQLHSLVTVINLEADSSHECDVASLQDEVDEVDYVIAKIQDSALSGVPVHEMAVVIPGRNPYGKIFALRAAAAGLCWNGLSTEIIAETAHGQALAEFDLSSISDTRWSVWLDSLINASAGKGKQNEIVLQTIKDELASWATLESTVPEASASLVAILRKAILNKTVPRSRSFGDGVYVNTLRNFEGLSFEKVFVIGVSDARFPSKARAIPLLPVGVGIPSAVEQQTHFKKLIGGSSSVSLSFSRTDRRNNREAFPSPWLNELHEDGNSTTYHSSLDLLQKLGPRTDESIILVHSLSDGVVNEQLKHSLETLSSSDIQLESKIEFDIRSHTFSASQLETFLNCPRKWFYKSVLKLKEPPQDITIGFNPMDLGEIIHKSFETLFTKYREALKNPSFEWQTEHSDELHHIFEDFAKLPVYGTYTWTKADDVKRWKKRLTNVLKKDTEHRSVGAIPIDFEKGIEADLCGLRFRGKIDRIDQIGYSGLHIIDYKSSTQNKSYEDLAKHPTGHGSKIQNLLYMALVLETGVDNQQAKIDKLSSSYWFLAESDEKIVLTQNYGENERETLFKTLNIIKSMLEEGLVPMTPKDQFPDGICGYCSFTQICPSNRMAIHERQKSCANGPFAQFLALSEKKTDAKSKSNQPDTEEK